MRLPARARVARWFRRVTRWKRPPFRAWVNDRGVVRLHVDDPEALEAWMDELVAALAEQVCAAHPELRERLEPALRSEARRGASATGSPGGEDGST